jgi:hypothetical protein
MSITSPITALAVGPWPAPGAAQHDLADAVALQHHHVGAALHWPSG